MPIYEYYCPDNNTVYQFYAKTLAQGETVPKCPANPSFRMEKRLSRFAISRPAAGGDCDPSPAAGVEAGDGAEDPRLEAAMEAMEKEFSSIDDNDPRAMGRMMRRMAELTGESLEGEMEEVVRKLEEGADPESLEGQLDGADPGGAAAGGAAGEGSAGAAGPRGPAGRRAGGRRAEPIVDPTLHDY